MLVYNTNHHVYVPHIAATPLLVNNTYHRLVYNKLVYITYIHVYVQHTMYHHASVHDIPTYLCTHNVQPC